jgi:hypothetical protein
MSELVNEVRAWLAWAQDSGLQNLAGEARRQAAAAPGEVEGKVKLTVLDSVRTELG